MFRSRAAPLLLLLATACGPTLTRGPGGWHEASTSYSVAPLDDGRLFPAGWDLRGYTPADGGFRRHPVEDGSLDFALHRSEDDGVLLVATEVPDDSDRSKLPEVFADRWLDRVVGSPKSDDPWFECFGDVVPPLKMTQTGTAGWGWTSVSVTALRGRDVHTTQRDTFVVPGGTAAEVVAWLSPAGAPQPDRGLYLAVVKQNGGERYVVVAYGNTAPLFERGLDSARSFAHRLRL